MNRKALRKIKNTIASDLTNFSQSCNNLMKRWDGMLKVEIANLNDYTLEITKVDTASPETAKPSRKRIASIPEDDVLDSSQAKGRVDPSATANDASTSSRPKRGASIKAIQEIKNQQINSKKKLYRPESPETSHARSTGVKRSKVSNKESEEEEEDSDEKCRRPAKQMRSSRMQQKSSHTKRSNVDSPKLSESIASRTRSRTRSRSASTNNNIRLINETLIEPSMYENAISKNPMNSTMKPNTTMTIDRQMLNITVTLDNNPNNLHRNLPIVNHNATHIVNNPPIININDVNNLITDDESSPESKNRTYVKKLETGKHRKRIKEISSDSEDEIDETAPPPTVKKRAEALEQAANYKPATPAATRTKTRVMNAAANDGSGSASADKTNNQASTSSKMKTRIGDEKENALPSLVVKNPQSKVEKLTQNLKLTTTPVKKTKLKIPMPVNRMPQAPTNIMSILSKAVTTSKVTNVTASNESTQKSNQSAKSTSIDSLMDKKLKLRIEESARKRKEEALKAALEEKQRKREEKELRIKILREANEKLEAKKRAKLEKEKEEKARQAELILENQRRIAEEKKKADAKEKKRKEEEKLRLLKLQEREETERLLAQQKKRELEAERRKIAEERARKIAAAEAAKVKQQYQAKVQYMQQKNYDPHCYNLGSEPESTDDEDNPKYPTPYWSKSVVRKNQVKMQEYIPLEYICKFFRSKAATVNLQEYFVNIEKNLLKRSSSARWSTPRSFMMQSFQE